LDSVAPLKQVRIKIDNQPWFDDELRKLNNERNRIHSFAYDFPPSDPIWDRFRQIRNKSLNRWKMCEFFKDKSTSYFKTNKKFWAFYKSVIKTKNSSNNQTIGNILDIKTNQSVSSAEDISRVFNEHFTKIKCEAVVSGDPT
jgi:hypothetical protein